MVIKTIDITQMQAVKEVLLSLLEADTEIILAEGDTPLARLTAVEKPVLPTGKRIPDLFPGIWMSDDFNDPLPDEFWLGTDA
jgi:hypothetical protein